MRKRWILIVAGVLVVGTLAAGASWRYAVESSAGGAQVVAAVTAPASRDLFPKVLSR